MASNETRTNSNIFQTPTARHNGQHSIRTLCENGFSCTSKKNTPVLKVSNLTELRRFRHVATRPAPYCWGLPQRSQNASAQLAFNDLSNAPSESFAALGPRTSNDCFVPQSRLRTCPPVTLLQITSTLNASGAIIATTISSPRDAGPTSKQLDVYPIIRFNVADGRITVAVFAASE